MKHLHAYLLNCPRLKLKLVAEALGTPVDTLKTAWNDGDASSEEILTAILPESLSPEHAVALAKVIDGSTPADILAAQSRDQLSTLGVETPSPKKTKAPKPPKVKPATPSRSPLAPVRRSQSASRRLSDLDA